MRLTPTLTALALIAGTVVAPGAATASPSAAASLIGVNTFVIKHCPDMRPNWPVVNQAFEEVGVDLRHPDDAVMEEAATWLAGLDLSRTDQLCGMIWSQFGRDGSEMPDVYLRN